MKNKILKLKLLISIFSIILCSCKKERQCYCNLSNGKRENLSVNDTKNKGQKKCFEWANGIKSQDPNALCYFD